MTRREWMYGLGGLALGVSHGGGCRPAPVDRLPPVSAVGRPTLGPGDLLEIRVTDQPELTGEYQVGEDGRIRFPWIEDVEVVDRSTDEVAETLETRLADGWLRAPQVLVRVVARQNREVSVLGQVNAPGSYPFKERLTLVQAISLAGGLNPLAQAKRVRLIRETAAGRQSYEVDIRQILESQREDLPLEPGDIVFVPEAAI